MVKKNKYYPLSSKILSILFGTVLLLVSPVYAQHHSSSASGNGTQAENSSEMSQQRQELQQQIKEMRQLQNKQQEIFKEVLNNNPELQKQEEKLRKLMQKTLDNNLASQDVDIERLKTLQSKLQEKDLDKGEKSKLEAEFSEKVQKYKEARSQTLNNQEIMEKREILVQKIQDKSSEAAKIGQEIQDLEQEIRESFAQSQQ
ncbi:MAG: hypothetical protein ACQES8_05045 [Thermodesulfobacteriota bacterium]